MALVYLVNKPHVLGRVIRWLLLFLEYDFTIVYKPSNVVVDVLLRLLNTIEPIGMHDQTIYANMFYTKPEWLNDVKDFLRTWHIEKTLSIQQNRN
jgi:hypothetical protein